MASKTVSVLGLGTIGSIWAGHYRRAGVLAGCWNRTSQPETDGWMDDPADAARAANVVQLCLYDPASVRELLGRIESSLGPSRTVVQSSTIDPMSAEEFAAFVRATGASCPLDLPTLHLVQERLGAAMEAGYGEEDFVSLLKVLPQ